MTPPPGLQELIADVERDAPDGTALTRLRTAAATVASVTDTADAVLGYFVDKARHAGHSWAEIGDALGVTKQAAQQRQRTRAASTMTAASFERFTGRARAVVETSEDVARGLGHGFVGTEHLLLAMFADRDAVGTKVLLEGGLTAKAARKQVVEMIGRGPGAPDGDLPLTPRAVSVFTEALGAALALGHNYIGTEHLLLGLLRGDGVASTVLLDAGFDEESVRESVAEKLAGYRRT